MGGRYTKSLSLLFVSDIAKKSIFIIIKLIILLPILKTHKRYWVRDMVRPTQNVKFSFLLKPFL